MSKRIRTMMSRGAPTSPKRAYGNGAAPAAYSQKALPKDLQPEFDRLANAKPYALATALGTTRTVLERLLFAGRARSDVTDRIEASMRQFIKNGGAL